MRPTFPMRAAGTGAALAALGLLAACASLQSYERHTETEVREPASTWTGGLHCADGFGDARARLTLGGERGRVDAVLAYDVTDASGAGPWARLHLEGQLLPDGTLELRGTHWIDRPAGQDLFDVNAAVDDAGRAITGTVPQCGRDSSLYLEREAGTQ
jgi:hypothetical protein